MNTTLLLQELCLLFNVLVCFGIPIVGTMVMTKKGCAPMRPFFMGMAALFVSQILSMIISGLVGNILGDIGIGLVNAVIAVAAQTIFLWLLAKKQKEFWDGLAFGLGFGGFEAVLMVGLPDEAMMMALMKNADAATGTFGSTLLSGVERIFFMALICGVCLLIWNGIQTEKLKQMVLIAGLLQVILQVVDVLLIQNVQLDTIFADLLIGIYGFCVLAYALSKMKKLWEEKKQAAQPKKKSKKKR